MGGGRADGDNVSGYFCRLARPHGCRYTQIRSDESGDSSVITDAYLEFAEAGAPTADPQTLVENAEQVLLSPAR